MDPFTSATELAAAVRRREVSPVELVELYLSRIDQIDPTLNAFCHRDDERVLAWAADAADAVVAAGDDVDGLGAFHGVPLPIKDLNRVAGWPTTYGSEASSAKPNDSSDPVVERFIEAGFIPLGMTNAPELGSISFTESQAHGVTRNPWNTDHTPGGSSGGAAAAVASGMAPIAHASDGGGSIRIPAACCGLVGLKPSRNRVPNGPNELEGFATSGVVTRTVADTAAVLDVIGRPDPLSWYNARPPSRPFAELALEPPRRLRIGITTVPPLDLPVEASCVEAAEAAAAALEALGHSPERFELSMSDPDRFIECFGAVWNTGVAGVPLEDRERMEPLNRALWEAGRATDSIAYVEALQVTQVLARVVVAPFVGDGAFDVLVTPTMAVEPPRCGSVWEGSEASPLAPMFNCFPMAVFTSVWNVTGLPALSLPLSMSASGLPVGVQFVAGPWREGLLLALGRQLEEALPWTSRRPTVGG